MRNLNGNGCTCDKCHKSLEPREAVKLKMLNLTEGNGIEQIYETIDKADLCVGCYAELKRWFRR